MADPTPPRRMRRLTACVDAFSRLVTAPMSMPSTCRAVQYGCKPNLREFEFLRLPRDASFPIPAEPKPLPAAHGFCAGFQRYSRRLRVLKGRDSVWPSFGYSAATDGSATAPGCQLMPKRCNSAIV